MTSQVARRIGLSMALFGVNPITAWHSSRNIGRYVRDLHMLRQLSRRDGIAGPRLRNLLPSLADAAEEAGSIRSEYFLADLWAARRIYEAGPTRHVDVGSRIDGLVGHLLTFMRVEVVDIRPLHSALSGLDFVTADATTLDGIPSGSLESVSSLHAIEHFGLGRYGDPIDPSGHEKGIRSLGRVVAPGGSLYLGFPVGRPTIEFNAHRVLDPRLATDLLPEFDVIAFAAVVDGTLDEGIQPSALVDTPYACGIYHMRRRG